MRARSWRAMRKDASAYETELREAAQGLNAVIAGHVRDMAAAYLAADIVVSASTDPEAFGRVAAEAGAMGRAVIATDHGGARETVIGACDGFSRSTGRCGRARPRHRPAGGDGRRGTRGHGRRGPTSHPGPFHARKDVRRHACALSPDHRPTFPSPFDRLRVRDWPTPYAEPVEA